MTALLVDTSAWIHFLRPETRSRARCRATKAAVESGYSLLWPGSDPDLGERRMGHAAPDLTADMMGASAALSLASCKTQAWTYGE